MVPDTRCGLRGVKVAAGGLEEFKHRLIFKRWRIGEVDHHLRARHGLPEALAGDAVDAALGRRSDDVVAALAQNGDGLRADQAGATDDDDLHSLHSQLELRAYETLSLTHVVPDAGACGLVSFCYQLALGISPE